MWRRIPLPALVVLALLLAAAPLELALSRDRPAPGMTASTAPADSMKDGWKT